MGFKQMIFGRKTTRGSSNSNDKKVTLKSQAVAGAPVALPAKANMHIAQTAWIDAPAPTKRVLSVEAKPAGAAKTTVTAHGPAPPSDDIMLHAAPVRVDHTAGNAAAHTEVVQHEALQPVTTYKTTPVEVEQATTVQKPGIATFVQEGVAYVRPTVPVGGGRAASKDQVQFYAHPVSAKLSTKERKKLAKAQAAAEHAKLPHAMPSLAAALHMKTPEQFAAKIPLPFEGAKVTGCSVASKPGGRRAEGTFEIPLDKLKTAHKVQTITRPVQYETVTVDAPVIEKDAKLVKPHIVTLPAAEPVLEEVPITIQREVPVTIEQDVYEKKTIPMVQSKTELLPVKAAAAAVASAPAGAAFASAAPAAVAAAPAVGDSKVALSSSAAPRSLSVSHATHAVPTAALQTELDSGAIKPALRVNARPSMRPPTPMILAPRRPPMKANMASMKSSLMLNAKKMAHKVEDATASMKHKMGHMAHAVGKEAPEVVEDMKVGVKEVAHNSAKFMQHASAKSQHVARDSMDTAGKKLSEMADGAKSAMEVAAGATMLAGKRTGEAIKHAMSSAAAKMGDVADDTKHMMHKTMKKAEAKMSSSDAKAAAPAAAKPVLVTSKTTTVDVVAPVTSKAALASASQAGGLPLAAPAAASTRVLTQRTVDVKPAAHSSMKHASSEMMADMGAGMSAAMHDMKHGMKRVGAMASHAKSAMAHKMGHMAHAVEKEAPEVVEDMKVGIKEAAHNSAKFMHRASAKSAEAITDGVEVAGDKLSKMSRGAKNALESAAAATMVMGQRTGQAMKHATQSSAKTVKQAMASAAAKIGGVAETRRTLLSLEEAGPNDAFVSARTHGDLFWQPAPSSTAMSVPDEMKAPVTAAAKPGLITGQEMAQRCLMTPSNASEVSNSLDDLSPLSVVSTRSLDSADRDAPRTFRNNDSDLPTVDFCHSPVGVSTYQRTLNLPAATPDRAADYAHADLKTPMSVGAASSSAAPSPVHIRAADFVPTPSEVDAAPSPAAAAAALSTPEQMRLDHTITPYGRVGKVDQYDEYYGANDAAPEQKSVQAVGSKMSPAASPGLSQLATPMSGQMPSGAPTPRSVAESGAAPLRFLGDARPALSVSAKSEASAEPTDDDDGAAPALTITDPDFAKNKEEVDRYNISDVQEIPQRKHNGGIVPTRQDVLKGYESSLINLMEQKRILDQAKSELAVAEATAQTNSTRLAALEKYAEKVQQRHQALSPLFSCCYITEPRDEREDKPHLR